MDRKRALVLAVGLLVAGCATQPPPTLPSATAAGAEAPPVVPSGSTGAHASASASKEAAPSVWVERGLVPRMTPDAVAARAMDSLLTMERMAGQVVKEPRILSIRASGREERIEWEVRAEGTFVVTRPGLAARRPPPMGSGYFLISDADGSVIGYGRP